MKKKPEWLRVPYINNENNQLINKLLDDLKLNTVCTEANCPNRAECFSKKTATFMILGKHCTRKCRFCNVAYGVPDPIDISEPAGIATAVERLGLRYVVITSVTRDDLADGGALHFADTIRSVRKISPDTRIEVLIPDLTNIDKIIKEAPDVISHNIETVKSLYSEVRPEANYERSLDVLRNIKKYDPKIYSKSGIMLGMGETKDEILKTFDDLLDAGCEFLTIGQYLSPSKNHFDVHEYINPEIFAEYAEIAKQKGFIYTASAPFVRSSYQAEKAFENLTHRN